MRLSKKSHIPYITHILPCWIALLLISSMSACSNCNHPTAIDYTGQVQMSVDPAALQDQTGVQARQVKATFQLTPGSKASQKAQLADFKLKVNVQAVGGTPGTSLVAYTAYDEAGESTPGTVRDGSEVNEKLYHFLQTGSGGFLDAGEELVTTFIVQPDTEATSITLTFQLLDTSDAPVGEACTVIWQAGPRFKLAVIGLNPGDLINTNKFTLQITKTGPGGVVENMAPADVGDLKVQITSVPDDPTAAKIKKVANLVAFANADLNIGKLEKVIEVKPAIVETIFTLQLQHPTIAVNGPIRIIAPAKPDVQIKLAPGQKMTLEGNSQKQVTLTITAGAQNLTAADLQAVTLAYSPDNGTLTYAGVDALHADLQTLDVPVLAANAVHNVDLVLDNEGYNKVTFKNIKLEGSAQDLGIPSVTWKQKVPRVKIKILSNPNLTGPKNQVTLAIKPDEDLTLDDLQALTLSYSTNSTDVGAGLRIRNKTLGQQYANNFTLDQLLELTELKQGIATVLTLQIYPGVSKAPVTFTDIALEGSANAAKNKIPGPITWQQ